MKRPLAVCAIALSWGIILSDVNISHTWGMVTAALSIIAMLLLFRPGRGRSSTFLYLAIPFLITGYGLHSINRAHYDKVLAPWVAQNVTVEGKVADEPEFLDGKIRFTCQIKKIQSDKETAIRNVKIRVTIYSDHPLLALQYGSMVRLQGEIAFPEGRRNIGGFDTKKFLAAKAISGTMAINPRAVTVLEEKDASWLKSAGYKVRHAILCTLEKNLPPKEASMLAGILIGYTADMPEEMEEDFRRAGLSHTLAVSGANIAFLLLPLLGLLQRLGFNRRWSSALSFPLMILFVFATGMEASVVRAAIMAGVTLTGMILWRKTDIFCSMAASAVIILLINSYMLFDMGFLLSFLATLSLVVFHKPLFGILPARVPKKIRDTLAGTIAAQLGVIPIIAYNFNTFSMISILSNLLVVPLTGLLTLLGAILAIAGGIFPWTGPLLGFVTRMTADLILFITENVARLPWAEINIATPDFMLVLIYYLVLLYIRFGHPRLAKEAARPLLAGICVICGIILVLTALPSHSLKIYFADVGQGDCVLIRTPKGKNIIIDGGGSMNDEKGSYAGERIVVPLLYDLNMTDIDIMIATHGHADHIGGLRTVLDKVPVKSLVIADAPDVEMRILTDYASKKGIPLQLAAEGELIYQEATLSLMAVYPFKDPALMPQSATVSANELSLVTRLEFGDFSALFTGDIGEETEQRIMLNGRLEDCDVLKVAHHGSKYSSGEAFIDKVDPSLAVVLVGRNKYGHPSSEVLERLQKQGASLYNTKDSGGILLEAWETDGRMRLKETR